MAKQLEGAVRDMVFTSTMSFSEMQEETLLLAEYLGITTRLALKIFEKIVGKTY